MRVILSLFCLTTLIGLPVRAAPAEENGSIHVIFRYAEIPYETNQDAVQFLRDLANTVTIPEASVEIVNLIRLPAEGGEVSKEFSTARHYDYEGQKLLGVEEFSVEVDVKSYSETDWLLESLYFQVGEEAPFSVLQRSGSPESGGETVTQRTRSVGFIVSVLGIVLKGGEETLLQAEVNTSRGKPVCRILTAGVYPQGQ